MAEDPSEVNELYGRGLDGKFWVMNGRLVKKEVKKEDEQQKSIDEGTENQGDIIANGDNENDANSVSDHSTSVSHPITPPLVEINSNDGQSQWSVKVEEEQAKLNEGDSMVEELQKLRAMVVANERTLKDKELLNAMLVAKLEEVREDKKAREQQLEAEIGNIRDEKRRQCSELERQLIDERQKNAQLTEELKLAKGNPNNMDKEADIEANIGHSENKETTTIGLQPSRAVIAARLLGIDAQLLEEPQPNDWKEKFDQVNIKYLKLKGLYRTEQKVAAKLRNKLKEDKQRDGATEELPVAQSGDDDQETPVESNEAVSSPIQNKIQMRVRKNQRRFSVQQLGVELPPMEQQEEDEVGVQQQPIEELNGPVTSPPLDTIQLGAPQRKRQRLLTDQQLDTERPPETIGQDAGGREEEGEMDVASPVPLTSSRPIANARRPVLDGNGGGKAALPTMEMKERSGASTVATVSTGGGVFKCPTCPDDHVAYSSAEQLARHQQLVHGDHQHWRHQCPECGHRVQTPYNLQAHMRTHSGEKPHKCRECGRGFAEKSALIRHERVHTDERPYVCPVCQKAFRQNYILVVHARVHSGETPYRCQHCARQFNQSSTCHRHEKRCPKKHGGDSA